MKNALLLKFALIAVVIVLTVVFGFPVKDKVNLGLDLQGGAYLLMQVRTETAVEDELGLRQSYIGQALKDEGLAYQAITIDEDGRSLNITGTPPDAAERVKDAIVSRAQDWTVRSLGGGNWTATMSEQYADFVKQDAVRRTLEVVRKRVDSMGVAEPMISKQGLSGDRILIQLPGVEDPEFVKDLLGKGAQLQWKEVSYPPGASGVWAPPAGGAEVVTALFGGVLPADTELVKQEIIDDTGQRVELYWPLKKVAVVSGNDLRNAQRSADEWNNPVVVFDLNADAGRRFQRATRENIGKIMVIQLDDEVISAPRIESEIRTSGQIRGGFDLDSADSLALQLRSGAIPAKVDFIEERTVGPSLGADSIRSGLTAGLAGFVGVMLFMLIYYRLSGVNAVVALGLNVLLVFGVLGAMPVLFPGVTATLTLPGIAGLILTVGMAVDSNVLIFERIREELSLGKTVRSAVEQGFGKALVTILDCNVTTLVAAFFLFAYGTGPVKGFAVTLTIGLLSSMFTAVFVSRQLFELVLTLKGRSAESLSI